jgi:hypothetical protein
MKSLAHDPPDIDGIHDAAIVPSARAALRAYGATHVALLKEDFRFLPGLESEAPRARDLLVDLLGPPFHEDLETALFRVPEADPPPFVFPERGFRPVHEEPSGPARVVEPRARLGLWMDEGKHVVVRLVGRALGADRRVTLRFPDGAAATVDVSEAEVDARYRGHANAGFQILDLTCDAAPGPAPPEGDGACLVLTEMGVETAGAP